MARGVVRGAEKATAWVPSGHPGLPAVLGATTYLR